jgi:glycosyltransferase involved in cell wall biosynthesis
MGSEIEPTLGMSAGAPRVSVVMAVYNGAAYLKPAIDSVLAQTFPDFELIVVNDGSTDASRDIVLAAGDRRIRLLDNPRNLGLTPSLNRGLEAARGEFIARLDADDVATPDRLARQVAFLDRNPDIALVGSFYRLIDPRGRVIRGGKWPRHHNHLRWSLLFYCPFNHSAVTWRRGPVSAAIGPYDGNFQYAMDWEYWSRMASRLRVANIPRVLTLYRVGPHSMSSNHPRVRDEIDMARQAAFRAVFGEDSDRWLSQSARLFPMVDGWPDGADAAMVRDSLQAVSQLHEAFVDRLRLSGRELARQRRWILDWMARRLLTAGRKAHLAQRHEHGRLLFAEARRFYAPILLTINCGRYFVARALSRLGVAGRKPKA